MARPWKKGSAWPYVAKSGRKSYAVGFYDHDKRGPPVVSVGGVTV
jgi:hypothetical protein